MKKNKKMYLIKEITDISIGEKPKKQVAYKIRRSARAIVKNKEGLIPLLYSKKENYYKLPGGGIDGKENIMEALQREFIEEVGAKIEIEKELGFTIEIKDKHEKIQFSYVYVGKVIEIIGEPDFTESEIEEGLELCWFDEKEAFLKIKNSKPKSYTSKMKKYRDKTIFEYYLNS